MSTMSNDETKRPLEEEEADDPAPSPSLRVLFSKEEGIVSAPPRLLGKGTFRIGRCVPFDELLLSKDTQSSREHAMVVTRQQTSPIIRDLGSSNGTFVNGERISEVSLTDGDIIRIGGTLLIYREEPASVAGSQKESFQTLLGQSPAIRRLRREISLIGPSLATVLLLGESGSGKEATAQALHDCSGLKGRLVAVNCSAIPESLAESQLFGHVGGAFTGAKEHPGYFRAANGGTLFLDEVGELPSSLQPKFLRVLEEGMVTPVGAVTPVPCKVRLMAATNRDLSAAVDGGRMRGDLLARLAEIVVRLPPLRERREDVLLLLQPALGNGLPPLSLRLAEGLLLYPWPYNVRELFKVATELRVRGVNEKVLGIGLVEDRLRVPSASNRQQFQEEKSESSSLPLPPIPSRDQLIELLREHHGRISAIAQTLQRSRTQIYRLLEQMKIDIEEFRGPRTAGAD